MLLYQEPLLQPGDSAETIAERLSRLSPAEVKHLNRKMEFAKEYAVNFDAKAAAEAVGCLSGEEKKPSIRQRVEEIASDLSVSSDLRAQYVRSYIFAVLDFCPTDYFFVAEDGDWKIDPDQFRQLPVEVKRLVESVEMRCVRGRPYVSVKFVSKTAALKLAAAYTLTQKIQAEVRVVPWDEVAKVDVDSVEDRIRGLLPRPTEAGEAPVAESDILQGTETDNRVGVEQQDH